jgi:hypothetical protein
LGEYIVFSVFAYKTCFFFFIYLYFLIFSYFYIFYTFGFFWLADRLNWPLAGLAGWSGWLVWLAGCSSGDPPPLVVVSCTTL